MEQARSVFVTGGAGFVGATLVRDLLVDGHHVTVYDNWANAAPERLTREDPELEIVSGDIRDQDRIRAALSRVRPDVVIHLAAIHFIPYCNEHPEECWDVNTIGTLRLMQALRDVPCARVVIASTAAVYPAQLDACREDARTGPLDIYGASKQACEALGTRLAVEEGIPVVAARLFNVFGPGETNDHVIPAILAQIGSGEPLKLGNITAERDYIHVRDVSRALRTLAAGDTAGFEPYNVGSGVAWSVADVLDILREAMGRPLEITTDAGRMRQVDRPMLLADRSRIERDFGWQPTVAFREGLLELLEESGAYHR